MQCIQKFEMFYSEKYSGRKLFWVHNQSNGVVRTGSSLYKGRPYEIHCTTYQMTILDLFNTSDVVCILLHVRMRACFIHFRSTHCGVVGTSLQELTVGQLAMATQLDKITLLIQLDVERPSSVSEWVLLF